MKKYSLFFILVLITFQASATNQTIVQRVQSFLWHLVKPCYNADRYVDINMRIWYQTNRNSSAFDYQRQRFPEHDANSHDRLAKDMILSQYNQKELVGLLAIDGDMTTHEVDPNQTWNRLPLTKRTLWTFLHRRPYTYIATLCKWGAEIGAIACCVKILCKIKSRLFRKNKKEDKNKKSKNNKNFIPKES